MQRYIAMPKHISESQLHLKLYSFQYKVMRYHIMLFNEGMYHGLSFLLLTLVPGLDIQRM